MIYVHIPFCRSFCTYCDFYSEKACPGEDFVSEVCAEAQSRRAEIAATAAVDTLYFGGGTPSVMSLEDIGRIADACGSRHYREWTLEVNPDDITPEYAGGLRALGVNRVSMGVQSLDDSLLRWMNRRHSAAGARFAYEALRAAGFDNISLDIIFGINGLSLSALEDTVRRLTAWRPEHISAYQLSVEEGSALGRLAREGRYTELGEEECSRQYYLVCELLAAAGYEHYEISNWALPGRRAIHNSAYWTRAPYVGLGPGAHSLRRAAAGDLRSWNSEGQEVAVSCGGLKTESPEASGCRGGSMANEQGAAVGFCGPKAAGDLRSWNSEDLRGWKTAGEVLTAEQVREEQIMLGLRTADGIPSSLLCPSEREVRVSGLGVPDHLTEPDMPGRGEVVRDGCPFAHRLPEREAGLSEREVREPRLSAAAFLAPSAIPGRLRIPEDRWFTADDIISSLV